MMNRKLAATAATAVLLLLLPVVTVVLLPTVTAVLLPAATAVLLFLRHESRNEGIKHS